MGSDIQRNGIIQSKFSNRANLGFPEPANTSVFVYATVCQSVSLCVNVSISHYCAIISIGFTEGHKLAQLKTLIR